MRHRHRGCAQLLGRAEDARAFVRHGAEEGVTEITLSGGAGERPVKVSHLIRSKGERVSEWKLNGEAHLMHASVLLLCIVCQPLAHAGRVAQAWAGCLQNAFAVERAVTAW